MLLQRILIFMTRISRDKIINSITLWLKSKQMGRSPLLTKISFLRLWHWESDSGFWSNKFTKGSLSLCEAAGAIAYKFSQMEAAGVMALSSLWKWSMPRVWTLMQFLQCIKVSSEGWGGLQSNPLPVLKTNFQASPPGRRAHFLNLYKGMIWSWIRAFAMVIIHMKSILGQVSLYRYLFIYLFIYFSFKAIYCENADSRSFYFFIFVHLFLLLGG